MNYWKNATFILIFLMIILSISNLKNDEIEISGLKISGENFGNLDEAMPEGQYNLCSMTQSKCVRMLKQKLP